MPLGSKVLEKGTAIHCLTDLPVVRSHGANWVRGADPTAEHTRISKPSKAALQWLLQYHRPAPDGTVSDMHSARFSVTCKFIGFSWHCEVHLC